MQPRLFLPTARQTNWLLIVGFVAVGEALRALRDARLTGAATTRADQEALVRALLQKTAG